MSSILLSPFSNRGGNRSLPWWLCPTDRELSLRSKIKTGYSTIASRANINKYHPIVGMKIKGLSVDELMIIEDVVKKSGEIEKLNELRVSSLLAEHDKLKERCEGNGTTSCLLCGYDFTQPHNTEKSTTCHICSQIVCTDCRYDDVLKKRNIYLCPVCFSKKELWCKTGAWMINSLPKQTKKGDELEEWMTKTSETKTHKTSLDMSSIELGGTVRQDTVQNLPELAEDCIRFGEKDEENFAGSYNVKFIEDDNKEDTPRPHSQVASSDWNTLENLREEEKTGIDDLLLAQQLRAESPRSSPVHFREEGSDIKDRNARTSISRSSAMTSDQRNNLIKLRGNRLSRTPSPGGAEKISSSPPPQHRAFLKSDISRDEESDSSIEINKELEFIHQMATTDDSASETPHIFITSEPYGFMDDIVGGDSLSDTLSSPVLKRKNASRRIKRASKPPTTGQSHLLDSIKVSQDLESDLSFKPKESDLSFKPLESDLNFNPSTSQQPVVSKRESDIDDKHVSIISDDISDQPSDLPIGDELSFLDDSYVKFPKNEEEKDGISLGFTPTTEHNIDLNTPIEHTNLYTDHTTKHTDNIFNNLLDDDDDDMIPIDSVPDSTDIIPDSIDTVNDLIDAVSKSTTPIVSSPIISPSRQPITSPPHKPSPHPMTPPPQVTSPTTLIQPPETSSLSPTHELLPQSSTSNSPHEQSSVSPVHQSISPVTQPTINLSTETSAVIERSPEKSPVVQSSSVMSKIIKDSQKWSPVVQELQGKLHTQEIPEKSPIPESSSVMQESSLERSLEKSPLPTEGSLEKSPLPTERSLEKSPVPTERSLEKSPLPTERSLEKSPVPTERSLEKSPVPTERSLEKSPVPTERSTEMSSVTKVSSLERSPARESPIESPVRTRRRTLLVKSSPTPPPTQTTPTTLSQATPTPPPTQQEETVGSSFSFKRRNATRSGRSPSRSPRPPSTSSTTNNNETNEGMSTLERKRAKAREAASRLKGKGGGESSSFNSRIERDEEGEIAKIDGQSTLERKKAKAREAANKLKGSRGTAGGGGGSSFQTSRIERDEEGEIRGDRRLLSVEYNSKSPNALI